MSNESLSQPGVAPKSSGRGLSRVVAGIWSAQPRVQPLGLQYQNDWPRPRRPVLGLFFSIFTHACLILALIRVPYLVRIRFGSNPKPVEKRPDQTVYVLRPLKLSEYFPAVRPPGPGGKPARGNLKEVQPRLGNEAADSRGIIVSAPPNPDNFRQTIIQPASPPQLRIPNEIKLPNVIAGNFVPPPPEKPQPAPKIQTQTVSEEQLPKLKPMPQPSFPPVASLNMPEVQVPHLEVPLPSAPVAPAAPAPSRPPDAQQNANLSDLKIQGTTANGKALLSLSVDPGPASELIALPPGNRYGAFTIGAAGVPGSPGGVPGGSPGGGTGGVGAGGNGSSGVGPGTGGGGGGAAGEGVVSVKSSGLAGVPGGGVLAPPSVASLVFPVSTVTRPRQPRMLVTSGPAGGGGLSVYGVLRGRRIYTIYLPMPGKNWILQYCESTRPAQAKTEESRTVQVQLDPALVPPSVEEQFDFHRPALPKDKMSEMIVLHGTIREDGSVTEVKILKGLETLADQAALAAFERWRFKPALRAGNAVAVEVLVGIPAM